MTGLDVLEALGSAPGPVGLSELARALQADNGHVHRLLGVLTRRGYVHRDEANKTYTLGTGVVQLAGSLLRNMDIVAQARPLMLDLVNMTGESVHLAHRTIAGGVYIARERLARKVTVETEIGAPVVVHATSTGKALYCRDSAEMLEKVVDLDALERFTEHTITDRLGLLRDLAATAERGYALDNEELSIGVRCVASPVVDIAGRIRASIGISGPSTRLDERTIGKCAVLVCTAAKSLSELLGGEWDFPLPSSKPVTFE
ncbi:MAG: IclR family transcriptional regulator [Acidimicrobiia bacterium]|nr:IclR family transcriptional regulator [Acidimicrobiia bacterium]